MPFNLKLATLDAFSFILQIRRMRQAAQNSAPVAAPSPALLTAQIAALRAPRNIRTRGLAIAEHNPKIEKTARIAGVLREICEELANHKGKYQLLYLYQPLNS